MDFVFLIPVYNDAQGLKITLQSLAKHAPKYDIIISDNCSSINYEQILSEYDKLLCIKYIRTTRNLGRVGNWNFVLREAEKYHYVWVKFLFSGEEVLPNFEMSLARLLSDATGAACIVHDYEFNQNGNISISKSGYNGFMDIAEVSKACLIDGGFLGSIVSNIYSTTHTRGKNFSDYFHGKNDFDFSVVLGHSALASDEVITRSNIALRRNFHASNDYWLYLEYGYNWSHWLEKKRDLLSETEYRQARYNVISSTLALCVEHYSLLEWCKVLTMVAWRTLSKSAYNNLKSAYKILRSFIS